VSAWLALNGEHICFSSIANHCKRQTKQKKNINRPESIDAAQSAGSIDPYESSEAHEERILIEKWHRDGMSDEEISNMAKQEAENAEKKEKANAKMMEAFERQAVRQKEAEAYVAWKAKNEERFRALYDADKRQEQSKTTGGEAANDQKM
jgi:hypothetical protein